MNDKPLDLLNLIHKCGYNIKESSGHVWYAYKYKDGKKVGHFSEDINELYLLCSNSITSIYPSCRGKY